MITPPPARTHAAFKTTISRRYFNQLFNHSYQARVLLEG